MILPVPLPPDPLTNTTHQTSPNRRAIPFPSPVETPTRMPKVSKLHITDGAYLLNPPSGGSADRKAGGSAGAWVFPADPRK